MQRTQLLCEALCLVRREQRAPDHLLIPRGLRRGVNSGTEHRRHTRSASDYMAYDQ